MKEPSGYMRRWAFNGEKPRKELNEKGKMVMPLRFQLLEVTRHKIFDSDVPLYPVLDQPIKNENQS